jgi:integrase
VTESTKSAERRLLIPTEDREKFETDPLIRRWVQRLAKGSEKTATMWSSGLNVFTYEMDVTPKELAHLSKLELQEMAERFETKEKARGIRGSTVAFRLSCVRHFVQFSGNTILPSGTFKVGGANESTEESALTREQLHSVLVKAPLRTKVIVSLMAQSGLRPGVIGDLHGKDGLLLGALRDFDLDALTFSAEPSFLRVPKALSKGGFSYESLIGEEGQALLHDYLLDRRNRGEKLTAESPLILTDAGRLPRSSEVGDYVRSGFKMAGLSMRPYALRTTFETRMREAEGDGLVTHDQSEFWAGHSGDMSHTYVEGRGSLTEKMVAQMRTAYSRCESILSSVPKSSAAQDRARNIADLIAALGDEESAARVRTGAEDPSEALQESVRKAVAARVEQSKQVLVPESDVGAFMERGYSVRMAVGGKFAMDPPSRVGVGQ